jgi:hypothetical protein
MCLRVAILTHHTGGMTELTSQADSALAPSGITAKDILSWPPTVDVTTAAPAFGLPRSSAYELARRGVFPAKVIKAGKHYRVVTADCIRVLGLAPASDG